MIDGIDTLSCQPRDHFIEIHIDPDAAAPMINIDWKLLRILSGHELIAGSIDCHEVLEIQIPYSEVGYRAGLFHLDRIADQLFR